MPACACSRAAGRKRRISRLERGLLSSEHARFSCPGVPHDHHHRVRGAGLGRRRKRLPRHGVQPLRERSHPSHVLLRAGRLQLRQRRVLRSRWRSVLRRAVRSRRRSGQRRGRGRGRDSVRRDELQGRRRVRHHDDAPRRMPAPRRRRRLRERRARFGFGLVRPEDDVVCVQAAPVLVRWHAPSHVRMRMRAFDLRLRSWDFLRLPTCERLEHARLRLSAAVARLAPRRVLGSHPPGCRRCPATTIPS